MATSSSPAEGLERFRTSFQSLLARAVENIAVRISNAEFEAPWTTPLDVAFFGLFHEIQGWPECQASLAAALSSPALKALAFSAAGVPHNSTKFWVNFTVYPAIGRYRELGPPNRVERKRLRRVTAEVVRWATLDPVQVKFETPLYDIRIPDGARFKVDEQTVMRTLTQEELRQRPESPRDSYAVFPDTPCLISTREMARLESPTATLPESFMMALELVVGDQIPIGRTSVAPVLPAFSLTNQTFGILRTPQRRRGLPSLISGRETQKARRIADAFADLGESGFDLALEHYHIALNNSDSRQRAINVGIALENLYLMGVGSELRYCFRLHIMGYARRLARCDRVTGDGAAKLYDARSTVVHGGRIGKSNANNAIERLNSSGLALVRTTLLSIVSRRNRRYLQSIGMHVDEAVRARAPRLVV